MSVSNQPAANSAVAISENSYGKSRVRLMKVERDGTRHRIIDVSVDVRLWGDFAAAYTDGDNARVVPTDTMKNTVYVLARRQPLGEIEEFAGLLANHFLTEYPQASRVRIAISQNRWSRIETEGREHNHAFVRDGGERRTTVAEGSRDALTVMSGIADLVVLKTSGSAFAGFFRDRFTTLKDSHDRLLGTVVRAGWTYAPGTTDFGTKWETARRTILEVFAEHDSRGVQQTLFVIGEAMFERIPEAVRIELSMPNRHCLLVDLQPFGLDNPNEVFVPTDEPHGLIEAVLTRA